VTLQSDAPPDDDPAAPRRRRRPDSEPIRSNRPAGAAGRDLPQAIAVGAALALVALLAFVAGPAATMVLVWLVITAAGFEYYGAVHRGGFRPATLLGLIAVAALPAATYWKGEAAFPMILFLSFVAGVLWYLLGVGGKARPTANLGVTMLGIIWVGVLGSFAALILKIPSQGVSILLVAVVAAVANDIGAFFVGRAMGRTPLSATSPNKTIEGLVGGMVVSLIGVFVVSVMLGFGPFSSSQALVFGLVLAVVAPLGDLAESLFKRDLGLKDMGSLLPEHGGVLDRFDGMLFVLPAAYYVVRVLGLAS
jgi:phosphatidate cytidylyltransferase